MSRVVAYLGFIGATCAAVVIVLMLGTAPKKPTHVLLAPFGASQMSIPTSRPSS